MDDSISQSLNPIILRYLYVKLPMLRYFRINDPYKLIILLVLMILAGLPLLIDLPSATAQELKDLVLGEGLGSKLMYSEIIDRTPPLMALMDQILDLFFGRSIFARHLLALILLFFQAAYFGILLINNKAYNENTYVPSLIFGFLCFFSFDVVALTPELLASSLLLLALNNIFKEIEFRVDRDSIVLNIGIFLGLASLVVFSYTIFLLGTVGILVLFARTTTRKVMLMLLGYVLVHGLVLTIYYFYGHSADLWNNFYIANITKGGVALMSFRGLVTLGAVPIGFFVFSLFMLTREAHFTRYQTQLFQVFFIWLFLAVIELLLCQQLTPHSAITLLPPVAYLISHYLLLIRRRRIAEFMLWIFILGILATGFFAKRGELPSVDYARMFAKPSSYSTRIQNMRVMIVGDDIGLYTTNSLGGSFLDWDLSRPYFEHPEFYENIVRMNEAFAEDPPDAIVDELNLVGPILERLPNVKKLYRKEGAVYWRL